MPLGTLDRTPPPFFKQGPSALSKLMFFSALALFLMVADTRFKLTQPLRAAVATVLLPGAVAGAAAGAGAARGGATTSSRPAAARRPARRRRARKLALQAAARQPGRAAGAGERAPAQAAGAARAPAARRRRPPRCCTTPPTPTPRKVVIDRAWRRAWQPGSPVIDESGVLGQVTRVYPLVSEVTLLTDRDQAIPVLNTRTGARSVAFGDPAGGRRRAGAALHGRQRRRAGGRPAHHQRRRRRLPARPAGGPGGEGGAPRRLGLCPHPAARPARWSDGARHVLVLKPLAQQLPPRAGRRDERRAAASGRAKGARR